MEVFISWSGERSLKLALSLRDWLPLVINSVLPFVSSEDIAKGTAWSSELRAQLENTSFGIICVTPENMLTPWIAFEAGAISKQVGLSKVCPLLLNMEAASLKGPLAQFQAARTSKEDLKKLALSVNSAGGGLEIALLERTFALAWPDLDRQLGAIAGEDEHPQTPRRDSEDLLGEVLDRVRSIERQFDARSGSDQISTEAVPGEGNPRQGLINLIRRGLGDYGRGIETVERGQDHVVVYRNWKLWMTVRKHNQVYISKTSVTYDLHNLGYVLLSQPIACELDRDSSVADEIGPLPRLEGLTVGAVVYRGEALKKLLDPLNDRKLAWSVNVGPHQHTRVQVEFSEAIRVPDALVWSLRETTEGVKIDIDATSAPDVGFEVAVLHPRRDELQVTLAGRSWEFPCTFTPWQGFQIRSFAIAEAPGDEGAVRGRTTPIS